MATRTSAKRISFDPADREHALRLAPVSRETGARLDRFVDMLLAWQSKTNLIAPSTVPHLWKRHIADSLQLLPLAPAARRWIDLGTGGGFPGLVIACALAEEPGASVQLVDSHARRAAFLREVIRTLVLPAIVHCQRIEDFVAGEVEPPDVITARALAPTDRLAGLIHPLMAPGTKALLLKGQDVEVELTKASKYWNIGTDLVQSRTDPQGRIVVVHALEPRS
ncbi:MAG: 16S rRNA (guanine(527)-N(7))-methyltransferase RsmG [Xanthobacteraceae bacterium]